MKTLYSLILSARPKQWVKNAFVFAAVVFVRDFTAASKLLVACEAFVLFCAASSVVYVLNDLVDVKTDRMHPTKRLRPLASGALSPTVALWSIFIGTSVTVAGAATLSMQFTLVLVAYIALNIAYSFWLKKVVLLDIISVATGFVLRVIGGAVAIHVSFSPWLIFCTFFLTLFLAVSKRKSELLLATDHETRPVLSQYSLQFIDQINTILLPMTLITYTFYTFSSEHSRWLMLTVPIVMYGLFRYLFILNVKTVQNDGPADDFLSDRGLQLTVFAWIVVAGGIVFYFR